MKESLEGSTDSIKESVKNIDLDRYTKPIRNAGNPGPIEFCHFERKPPVRLGLRNLLLF